PAAEHVTLERVAAVAIPRQFVDRAQDEAVRAVESGGAELHADVVQVGDGGTQTERVAAERLEARERVARRHLEAVREAPVEAEESPDVGREARRVGVRDRVAESRLRA